MTMKKLSALSLACAAMMFAAAVGAASTAQARGNVPGPQPVIYVTGQDLYYDSIVLTGLPMEGRFQLLVSTPEGLETEFGPGDPGYVGGRWWLDANGDGVMDEGDAFFMCPLLGPGREEP